MPEVPVTELVTLDVDEVHLVGKGANGFPALLMKQAQEEVDAVMADATKADTKPCPTCDGTGKIMEGNRDCPDCDGTGKVAKSDSAEADAMQAMMTTGDGDGDEDDAAKSDSPEADEQEDEMTGEAEKADADFLDWVEKSDLDDATKAELKAADRAKLADSDFAYIDDKGKRHLPIADKGHVQAALGRFGQTKFANAEDKAKAAGKIKAKAKEHGIDVDDESDVGQAAKSDDTLEKSPGVPDFATETPTSTGTVTTFAESGLVGPMTAGVKPDADTDPPMPLGGESTYVIPTESRLGEPRVPDLATKADEDDDLIHIVEKDGLDLMSMTNKPSPAASADPGDSPWESYDAATLDQVAQGLATCAAAVDNIRQREAVEAASGMPGDWQDAMDLETACDAIDAALGFIARLAYHEGAEAAQKSGRRLSSATESHVRAARDHLTALIGDGKDQPAGSPGTDTSEEDDIMATLTKEELQAMVAKAATDAVTQYDTDRKARKAQKAADAAERAEKNANNKGEVTEQDERDAVHGEHDASDLSSVGGAVKPEFVNKGEGSDEPDTETLVAAIKSLEERVEKFAKRPRSGGPVLDGVARAFVPAEGRQGEGVAKSAEEQEIDRLAKALDESTDVVQKAELSQQLTHARLYAAHQAGTI